MSINWFPGHMHKARQEIAKVMPQMDVIIEILDARIPFSSENPLVSELRRETPCIKVLNKFDLADEELTQIWVDHFAQTQGIYPMVMQAQPGLVKTILSKIKELVPARDFAISPIKALILGVPNVGKSTLINIMAERTIAKTGNEAGVTRHLQPIKLAGDIQLTDTPGFLWPKLTPPEAGYRLALTGAIRDTAFDFVDLGFFAVEFLAKFYPERLQERYTLANLPTAETDAEELLLEIGKKRGCVQRGGSCDWDKVTRILVNELQDGTLGRITLEQPDLVVEEVARAEAIAAQKAEEKAQRDAERRARAKRNRG